MKQFSTPLGTITIRVNGILESLVVDCRQPWLRDEVQISET